MFEKLKDLRAKLLRRQVEDLDGRIEAMWAKAVEAENDGDSLVYKAYVGEIEILQNKLEDILRKLGKLPPKIPMIPFQPNR